MDPHGGDAKPHTPGTSLWPVGFAIGIACLLIGLVVSWPAVAVGGGLMLVFGSLWVRDLAASRALPTPPPVEAVPARPAVAEEEDEVERFPRSRFLEGATLGVGALIGGAVTVPAIGFAVLPPFLHQGRAAVDLGPLEDFPEGQYVITTFLERPKEGEVSRRTAYVRNNGLLKGVPSFTIVSNRCVHLGCPVQPNGPIDETKGKTFRSKVGTEVRLTPVQPAGFGCPCHGGQYDTEGNRTAGPPTRALDRYEFSIRNGRLYLGRTYSVNYVRGEGANAKIRKFELTGPGEHVSGVEGWLYPLQPPH